MDKNISTRNFKASKIKCFKVISTFFNSSFSFVLYRTFKLYFFIVIYLLYYHASMHNRVALFPYRAVVPRDGTLYEQTSRSAVKSKQRQTTVATG